MPRLRIRFGKLDDLRLVSHRDLATAVERMFRRAGLPLAMSAGFHPHPKISFPSALALGIEGRHEVMEVEVRTAGDAAEVLATLQAAAPPGLVLHVVEVVPPGVGKAHVRQVTYELPIPADRQHAARERCAWLLSQGEYPIARDGRATPIDLRGTLVDADVCDGKLRFRCRATPEAAARPSEILTALEVADLLDHGAYLIRTEVELA